MRSSVLGGNGEGRKFSEGLEEQQMLGLRGQKPRCVERRPRLVSKLVSSGGSEVGIERPRRGSVRKSSRDGGAAVK